MPKFFLFLLFLKFSFFSRSTLLMMHLHEQEKWHNSYVWSKLYIFIPYLNLLSVFYIFFEYKHLRLSCCLYMNLGSVYDATQICQYVWCINNDYMQANGNVFHWSYRLERFLRRTRVLRSIFLLRATPSACVRACSRACVRERNTEKFGLSSSLSPSLHLLPCFVFFALFFFHSRAVRRKRKKLESCYD